jgi:hypothetical protein
VRLREPIGLEIGFSTTKHTKSTKDAKQKIGPEQKFFFCGALRRAIEHAESDPSMVGRPAPAVLGVLGVLGG